MLDSKLSWEPSQRCVKYSRILSFDKYLKQKIVLCFWRGLLRTVKHLFARKITFISVDGN